jgi:AraC-like DNA-binding protein
MADQPVENRAFEEYTVNVQEMSCSGRFIRAFAKVLGTYPQLQKEVDRLLSLPPDRRIALDAAYKSVERWVKLTEESGLGLNAALVNYLGCVGALDYALQTASSVRDSMRVASRFASLYSDALEPELSVEQALAIVRLRHRQPAPRAILDFTLGIWFRNQLSVQLEGAGDIECWFSYEEPADLTLHRRVFGDSKLHFSATFDGFSFASALLDRPLASAVPLLHALHCQHLAGLSESLAEPRTTTLRVRKLIESELSHGRPSATSIARELHMSRRTLVRRLESDGTTFRVELDELRRELALRLVATRSLSLIEITRLLGFSQVQGFHRAFKRWTGRTPLSYRAPHGGNGATTSS